MAGFFTYQPYTNPYADQISATMLRAGQIRADEAKEIGAAQAQAQQQSGAAWAQAAQGIGSDVSKAIVSEIQNNTVQRRRSARTLEALSLALDWHPGHLAAVLAGRRPPELGEPTVRSDDDVPARLAVIEYRLAEISQRLDDLSANFTAVFGDADDPAR